MKPFEPWTCHAHPVRLGGKQCGHVNTTPFIYQEMVCCHECGCTKHASDRRAGTHTPAHETFKAYRPRVGQPIKYEGKEVGVVTSVDGNLCYRSYPTGESLPFIWCFKDGLNALHEWPTKGNGPVCFCPGINSNNQGALAG